MNATPAPRSIPSAFVIDYRVGAAYNDREALRLEVTATLPGITAVVVTRTARIDVSTSTRAKWLNSYGTATTTRPSTRGVVGEAFADLERSLRVGFWDSLAAVATMSEAHAAASAVTGGTYGTDVHADDVHRATVAAALPLLEEGTAETLARFAADGMHGTEALALACALDSVEVPTILTKNVPALPVSIEGRAAAVTPARFAAAVFATVAALGKRVRITTAQSGGFADTAVVTLVGADGHSGVFAEGADLRASWPYRSEKMVPFSSIVALEVLEDDDAVVAETFPCAYCSAPSETGVHAVCADRATVPQSPAALATLKAAAALAHTDETTPAETVAALEVAAGLEDAGTIVADNGRGATVVVAEWTTTGADEVLPLEPLDYCTQPGDEAAALEAEAVAAAEYGAAAPARAESLARLTRLATTTSPEVLARYGVALEGGALVPAGDAVEVPAPAEALEPAEAPEAFTEYVARLLHAPKRTYAAALLLEHRGGPVAAVPAEAWAAKVAAKVARALA